MDRFRHLKIGLAAVLGLVGLKLLLLDVVTLPSGLSLGLILGILAVSVLASLRAPRG
jgi:tellurite resistance protein TerC